MKSPRIITFRHSCLAKPSQDKEAVWVIRVDIDNPNATTSSVEYTYKRAPLDKRNLRLDVSSPIGHYHEQTISRAEEERLERCVADLLMLSLQRELEGPGNIILIQGPPFSKLIGRIGYRFPMPQITIGFVTIEKRYILPVEQRPKTKGPDGWQGPDPGLQENCIVRTFYAVDQSIRLDLFAQGLHSYPINKVSSEGYPLGVLAKVQTISDYVHTFADKLARYARAPVDHPVPETPATQPIIKAARKSKKHLGGEPWRSQPKKLAGAKEEIYDKIANPSSRTETGQQRLTSFMEFLESDRLGDLDSRKNQDFLQFVETTLKHHGYADTEYVYTRADLILWHKEHEEWNEHQERLDHGRKPTKPKKPQAKKGKK